ncbi:MAG: trehalose-6-phosphate synthase, partial [Actinobacteria bacterium]|nr:trehalose-6-phosphate synthase [Actinomycetota bacterium]
MSVPSKPGEGAEAAADERQFDFIVVSNRLPVRANPAGGAQWSSGAGGLVSALRPVISSTGGAWVGWAGEASPSLGAAGEHGSFERAWFENDDAPAWADTGRLQVVTQPDAPECAGSEASLEGEGVHALPVLLDEEEVGTYYEGFCNATLWPLYHDVVAPPVYSRRWWHAYVEVNQRFASAVAAHAAPGATVWAHDYHLQLVPAMLRGLRDDLQIGWFNHIPFPPVELFAELPWRSEIVQGLLGADLVGFQTPDGALNFLRACRRFNGFRTQGSLVHVVRRSGRARTARVGAFPISVGARELSRLAQSPDVRRRARQIREDLGQPEVVLLGVDRPDYT